MPLSITFTQDPESSTPLHEHYLMERLYQPASKVWQVAKEYGEDYRRLMNSPEGQRTRDRLVPPRTLVTWMFEFIQELERSTLGEKFHFEIAYYIHIIECDEESEYAIRASAPLWFVTIRDFENSIVHKNWTIAFDDWADILIKRGKATNEDPMSHAPNFTRCEEMKARLFSSIKEHIRLRNFRLKRENNTIGTP